MTTSKEDYETATAAVLEKVEWWAHEATAAKAERDATIREARAAGYSLRAIGEAAGLTPQAVSNICERRP